MSLGKLGEIMSQPGRSDRLTDEAQAAPATRSVVCDYCLEEIKQSTLVYRFAFVHLNCSRSGIALSLVVE
jgi:hypothetical protein